MMIDLSAIQNSAIFHGLEPSDLDRLAEIAGGRSCKAGERLFKRGEAADALYIAQSGRFTLTLSVRQFDVREEFAVEEKAASDAFGWSCLVEPRSYIYSAYCVADGVVVCFPGEDLQRLLATNDHLGHQLAHNLNVLIGARVRSVQDLWVNELEQSHARVASWTHTEMTSRLYHVTRNRSEVGSG
ncbi:MAG: cyclic nucleotide-binding domain-containing protein [Myxococcota bacterium]|jgi:CRP-like cAMP-binding protein|nr:cyclic nucleotide-binding domain-containing protein [Myxococcota bacterium]